MYHNPDDLKMVVITDKGVRVEIYDTYCKNFTMEDKARVDEKINDILYRCELRKALARERAAEEAAKQEAAEGETHVEGTKEKPPVAV